MKKVITIVFLYLTLVQLIGCGANVVSVSESSNILSVYLSSEDSENKDENVSSTVSLESETAYEEIAEFVDTNTGNSISIGDPQVVVRDIFEEQLIMTGKNDSIGKSYSDNIVVGYNENGLVDLISTMGDECSFSVLGIKLGDTKDEINNKIDKIEWDDDLAMVYFDSEFLRCTHLNAQYSLQLECKNGKLYMMAVQYVGADELLEPTVNTATYETKAQKREEEYQIMADSLVARYADKQGTKIDVYPMHAMITGQNELDFRLYYDISIYTEEQFQELVCDAVSSIAEVSNGIPVKFNAFQVCLVSDVSNLLDATTFLRWNCHDDGDLTVGTISDEYNGRMGYDISVFQISNWIVESKDTPTFADEDALSMAKQYLDTMPFSYLGLIKQLEYEGFSTEEATYAADNCEADWNEQATEKAADYLGLMAFSRERLISQLEYDGFTYQQAVYGVTQNGL